MAVAQTFVEFSGLGLLYGNVMTGETSSSA